MKKNKTAAEERIVNKLNNFGTLPPAPSGIRMDCRSRIRNAV